MKKPAKTTAKRVAEHRERRRDVARKTSAPKRSKANFKRPDENDPVAWLLAYLPGAYPLPFGRAHFEIIDAVVYAIKHGDNTACAAPRGTGKSTIVNGLLLWALLTRRTDFPVVVPWDDKPKKRALRFWSQELCFNERLHRDYPDATDIFVRSRGISNRLSALTENNEATGARLGISEGIIVLPAGLGAIGSATINGNPRGLNYATIDGRIMRPTLAVVDDPQDRETAKSATRVRDTIDRIDGDIAGMAGPDQQMAMVMPCTVIQRNDVAEHYLNDPDWHTVRVGQVIKWPTGWDDDKSECRRLWEEWNTVRQDGNRERDGGKSAVKFYEDNKPAMIEGMEVSWDERYDRKRGQPDAFYAAIFDFFKMGEESFMAERQNEPLKQGVTLYTLDVSVICSRIADRAPGFVPDFVVNRVAATDVNPSFGLTWTIAGFGVDQTSAVIGYGVHKMRVPGSATKAELDRGVYENLIKHGLKLAELPCRPERWFIDAGGASFDAVIQFCVNAPKLVGLVALPCTGRGARNYRPYGKTLLGKPREQCHMAVDHRGRKWVAFNADYWREQAQKAWTGSVGAPGSCSLPRGHHEEFAEQVCREQLQGKAEIAGQMQWVWATLPGNHDYGDCMTMCYMGAAWGGIGTGGTVRKPGKKKRHRSTITRVQI